MPASASDSSVKSPGKLPGSLEAAAAKSAKIAPPQPAAVGGKGKSAGAASSAAKEKPGAKVPPAASKAAPAAKVVSSAQSKPAQPSSQATLTNASGGNNAALAATADEQATHRHHKMLAGWPVSMVLHAIGLVLLGVFMIAKPEKPVVMGIVSGTAEQDALEELDEIKIEPVEMQDSSTEFSADSSALDFQSIATENTATTQDVSTDGPEQITIGEEFGIASKGDLMKEISGDGGKGAATFFGVKSTGNRFCFVIDNSASMLQGRFEAAIHEVMEAVERLKPNQQFYVVFFSDTSYPLFYPNTASSWVNATQENKYRLASWLAKVPMCWKTQGEKAMETAFTLRPDVIYLLGDGAFTDKADDKTIALKGTRVTIHTLGFGMKAQDRAQFEAIANAFGGKFTDVTVAPQFKELEKRNNRPKHKTRAGVWGITLPAAK